MNQSIFELHRSEPYHNSRPLYFSTEYIWKNGDQKVHLFIELNKHDVIESVHYELENLDYWIPFFSIMAKDLEKNDIEEALEMVFEFPEDASFFPLHIYSLHNAIQNYKGEEIGTVNNGHLICRCFGVSKEQIQTLIEQNLRYGLKEVTEKTKACGGCTACMEDIEDIIYDVKVEKADELLKDFGSKEQFLSKMNQMAQDFLTESSLMNFYSIEVLDRQGLNLVVEISPENKKESILKELKGYLFKKLDLPLDLFFVR